jgi:hypothetical protein
MFFVDLRADVIPFMLQVEGVTEVGTYSVIHSLLGSEPAPMVDSCRFAPVYWNMRKGVQFCQYHLLQRCGLCNRKCVLPRSVCVSHASQ